MLFSPQIISQTRVFTGGAGGGVPGGAEAQAFLARASGLDATHQNAYADLIDGLVADGIWSKLDVLRIYATSSSANAVLNLVSSSYTGTINGSPTFTTDRGFTGVNASTTVYIESHFNPSTAPTPKFTRNSCHLSTWTLNSGGLSQAPELGYQDSPSGNSVAQIYAKYNGDNHTYVRPQTTGASGGDAGILADKRGHIGANRSSSVQVDGYQNGASIYSNGATASTAINNVTIGELGTNNGSAYSGCSSQQAMVSWGSSLNSTEWSNYYSRLRTYMTAVGVP